MDRPEAPPTESAHRPRLRTEARLWLLALLLMAPASLPYLTHYLGPQPARPTGFVLADLAMYMAKAREPFDEGGFRPLYGNPHSSRYATKRLYFHPQFLVPGAVMRLTGLAPGTVCVAWGFVAAWVCSRVMIALYHATIGSGTWPKRLGLVAFFWGGGLLSLTSYAYAVWAGRPVRVFYDFLDFDPAGGWWFLNLGRNLILPTEAYYHALFFGCILAILRRRYAAAAGVALLASISHPFTGLELLTIVVGWSSLERFFLQNTEVPRWFVWVMAGLGLWHLAYYLIILPGDPEHRAVADQMKVAWTLPLASMVPAYALVGALAAWSCRRFDLARRHLGVAQNRLFLVWFLGALLLAKHEHFVGRPAQPIHFERGYIWTALFLLGAGTLVGLLAALPARLGRVGGGVGIAAVLGLLLLDNALWLGAFPVRAVGDRWALNCDIRLLEQDFELFRWMDSQPPGGRIVLTEIDHVKFFAPAFTPLRTWGSHPFETARHTQRQAELRELFATGRMLSYWRQRPLLVVLKASSVAASGRPSWIEESGGSVVFQNPRFEVYEIPPASDASRVATRPDGPTR